MAGCEERNLAACLSPTLRLEVSPVCYMTRRLCPCTGTGQVPLILHITNTALMASDIFWWTWTLYAESAFSGYNLPLVQGLEVKGCLEACRAEPTCESVDYDANLRNCYRNTLALSASVTVYDTWQNPMRVSLPREGECAWELGFRKSLFKRVQRGCIHNAITRLFHSGIVIG